MLLRSEILPPSPTTGLLLTLSPQPPVDTLRKGATALRPVADRGKSFLVLLHFWHEDLRITFSMKTPRQDDRITKSLHNHNTAFNGDSRFVRVLPFSFLIPLFHPFLPPFTHPKSGLLHYHSYLFFLSL